VVNMHYGTLIDSPRNWGRSSTPILVFQLLAAADHMQEINNGP